jgi:hypothetical protein
MRITRSEGHHCIVLTDLEAECLVDACALVVLAGQSSPRATLPPQMGALLCSLFEGLGGVAPADTAEVPSPSRLKSAQID